MRDVKIDTNSRKNVTYEKIREKTQRESIIIEISLQHVKNSNNSFERDENQIFSNA